MLVLAVAIIDIGSSPAHAEPPLPACGGYTYPHFPQVLESTRFVHDIVVAKARNPGRTAFFLGVLGVYNDVWEIVVEETSNLAWWETMVVLHNKAGGWVNATAIDCFASSGAREIRSEAFAAHELRFSIFDDFTTLKLGRRNCGDPFCWEYFFEDTAVFEEAGFWDLFGGRKVTINWLQ